MPMHTLPSLPYAYEALEPVIDTQTMQIHHNKHHQAYIDNLNKAITDTADAETPLEELFNKISSLPAVVRNNAGGHWNHSFFWSIMTNTVQSAELKVQSTILMHAIDESFGSYDNFVAEFTKAALSRFGSGWAWLIKEWKNESMKEWETIKLSIISTPNQDNPLMDIAETKWTPLLGIDVREHAYYLKYQNKRADYIATWMTVVNWAEVERKYSSM